MHCVLLFIGGYETTVNLITNKMLTLLRHPEALVLLRRAPALMPSAVEELLDARGQPAPRLRRRRP